MRPSIAAALSTLGPIHSADAVLLAPTDVDRFADVEGPTDGRRRVIERPDGSLILMLEFEDDNFGLTYAFVGAVPKDAWTWADPKKRQPAPLARVNLDARDIHCLTQGGEVHRGATVGTTTDGRAALQAATRPLTFAGIDLRPSMQAFPGFWAAALSIKPADVTRTPKDGDRLDSFTAAELDALPVGARFDDNGGLSLIVKGPHGWSRAGITGTAGFCTSADMKALCFGSRTLVLPKPAEAPKPAPSPKVGDRLRDLTPEQRANLPIGTVLAPDMPGRFAMTKGDDGRWRDSHHPGPCETQWLKLDRAIVSLPAPPLAAPKVGDRWGALNDDQRAALPVGTVLKEEGCITVAAWTRLPYGWSQVVVDTSATAFYIVDTCEPTKTSVIAFAPVSK